MSSRESRTLDRRSILLGGATLAAISAMAAGAPVRTAQAQQNPVIAIDTLLVPDQTMIRHASDANVRLRQVFPKGFALDATHSPHITMLQRYVQTADLDKVYAAVGNVLASEKVTSWKLKAFKYYYIPSGEIGLAGIVIEPTDDLLRLQQKLIDAVAPFTAKTGTAAAFFSTEEGRDIQPALIEYVADFVPKSSGKNFNPHVTIGVATQDYLKKMLAEPFEAFTFSPAGAAVYHLGTFGTAQKKLSSWEFKP
jgi:2'-5' RNA ligase